MMILQNYILCVIISLRHEQYVHISLLLLKLTQEYRTLNPMQQVPTVEIDGITLSQSVSLQTPY